MPKRVVSLNRLGKPDIALLDELQQIRPPPLVFARNLDDEPQIRQHEHLRRFEVVFFLIPHGEFLLTFGVEYGVVSNMRQINREWVGRRRRVIFRLKRIVQRQHPRRRIDIDRNRLIVRPLPIGRSPRLLGQQIGIGYLDIGERLVDHVVEILGHIDLERVDFGRLDDFGLHFGRRRSCFRLLAAAYFLLIWHHKHPFGKQTTAQTAAQSYTWNAF